MKQRGALICFTGIDGSGKTTQAELLRAWLETQGIEAIYTWSRGEVLAIRNIFLFLGRGLLRTSSRRIASNPSEYREYQSRKSRLFKNALVRALWSITSQAEHLVQINLDIRRRLRDGIVVVCDRYLWDSTVDMAVLNEKKPQWLLSGLNKFMWRLVPRPALAFFIDIPPEEALRRKDDIPSLEYVARRSEHYHYLVKYSSLIRIDGCQDPAAVQSIVQGMVKAFLEREEGR